MENNYDPFENVRTVMDEAASSAASTSGCLRFSKILSGR